MAEHTPNGTGQVLDDTTFELGADDPRSTENRGGLESIVGEVREGSTAGTNGRQYDGGGGDVGTTGAGAGEVDDAVGARGTGSSNRGQVDLSTTGMVAPDSGPAEAGPIQGSASGATAPRVEMTDIGLVDVNVADMSPPGDGPDDGARVEDEDGNPL
jgi:hypothetical protein